MASATAFAGCRFRLDGSICPLRVGAGNTQTAVCGDQQQCRRQRRGPVERARQEDRGREARYIRAGLRGGAEQRPAPVPRIPEGAGGDTRRGRPPWLSSMRRPLRRSGPVLLHHALEDVKDVESEVVVLHPGGDVRSLVEQERLRRLPCAVEYAEVDVGPRSQFARPTRIPRPHVPRASDRLFIDRPSSGSAEQAQIGTITGSANKARLSTKPSGGFGPHFASRGATGADAGSSFEVVRGRVSIGDTMEAREDQWSRGSRSTGTAWRL